MDFRKIASDKRECRQRGSCGHSPTSRYGLTSFPTSQNIITKHNTSSSVLTCHQSAKDEHFVCVDISTSALDSLRADKWGLRSVPRNELKVESRTVRDATEAGVEKLGMWPSSGLRYGRGAKICRDRQSARGCSEAHLSFRS